MSRQRTQEMLWPREYTAGCLIGWLLQLIIVWLCSKAKLLPLVCYTLLINQIIHSNVLFIKVFLISMDLRSSNKILLNNCALTT